MKTLDMNKMDLTFPLTKEMFPSTLKKIITPGNEGYEGDIFIEEYPPNLFPDTLESLKLFTSFGRILKPGLLPKNLRILDIDMVEHHSKIDLHIQPGTLPSTLEELYVSTQYCQPNELGYFDIDQLPEGLKKVEFPDYYDYHGELPSTLQEIKFGIFQTMYYKKEGLPLSLEMVFNEYNNTFIKKKRDELWCVWMQFKQIELLNEHTRKNGIQKSILDNFQTLLTDFHETKQPMKRRRINYIDKNILDTFRIHSPLQKKIFQYLGEYRPIIQYELSGYRYHHKEPSVFFELDNKDSEPYITIDQRVIDTMSPDNIKKLSDGTYILYLNPDEEYCEIDEYFKILDDEDEYDEGDELEPIPKEVKLVYSKEDFDSYDFLLSPMEIESLLNGL